MKGIFHPFPGLKNYRTRIGLSLFSVFALAVVFFCIYLFAISFGRPYTGVTLVYHDQAWEVWSLDTNGLARSKGIQAGNIPVEINGQLARDFLKQYEKTGTVFGIMINELTVVDEQGKMTTVSREDVFPFWPIAFVQLAHFIICLFFWGTGFYVFFKRPAIKAARLLCIIGLGTGTLLCGNMAGDLNIQAGITLSIFSSVTGPWLLLHFFLVLPEEREWARKSRLVYLIYLIPLITLVLFHFFGFAEGQPLPGFRIIRYVEIAAALLAVTAIVIYNYTHAGSTRTRQQMKIILIACLTALLPFLILILLPQMLFNIPLVPPGYGILLLVFIPVGMGIAVITQRLMDIDFVLRRGVIYGLVSVVMAAILSGALFPLLAFQKSLNLFEQIIIVLFLGGIATALFGPSRKGIELLIDRLFYKDRYDYRQTIQRFSTSLNSLQEITDISRLIVGTTVQTLNLAGACLFVKSQGGFFEIGTAQGIFMEPERQQTLNMLISQQNRRIEFPNPASSASPEVAFLIPLTAGQKTNAVLCLSQKITRQHFSRDDVFLLQGLASVASTALDRAMLNRDVSLRNTFVSIASHELRIPLSAILGFSELMLLRNTTEETRKNWLTKILSHGQQINSMVDDLLNVSRIQSGKVNIKREEVRLDEFLAGRFSLVQESDSKHSFQLNIEPSLPMALIDRDKLGQVVGNLLSNAIKFSPRGGNIILSARGYAAGNRIVISVADEGIGISPADKETLFTTFHRIQRPETQGIRGSGLGLYIVKEWIHAMGGDVWLESELNKGSTFYVSIPTVNSRLAEQR